MKQPLLWACILLAQGVNAGAQAVTMTIACEDKAQPPYYLGDTNEVPEDHPGVAVEMVKALETKIPGLKIRLTRAPWKRCTTELGSGAYDGIFNASYRRSVLPSAGIPPETAAGRAAWIRPNASRPSPMPCTS